MTMLTRHDKSGMFESRQEMAKVVVPALCGLGGWAMVGLLIYWAVRG
jgi:hypothetical protein